MRIRLLQGHGCLTLSQCPILHTASHVSEARNDNNTALELLEDQEEDKVKAQLNKPYRSIDISDSLLLLGPTVSF